MYEELVKRLRERAECFDYDGRPDIACDYEEAADAIEELSRTHDADAKEIEWLKKCLQDLPKPPRWISVEERLPEQRINQNTLDFEYALCATTFGDVRPYKYGRRIGQGDAHFWNGAGYVDAYVTHWMPLPEPPKEET